MLALGTGRGERCAGRGGVPGNAGGGLADAPFVLDDLAEAVHHARVGVGAGRRAGLELSGRGVSFVALVRLVAGSGEAYTLVLTTSRGYLDGGHSG